MTQVIINDILPLTQAVATGGQTVYSTDWTANYASDVVVYSRAANTVANDVTQIVAYPAGYSVAFIGGSLTVQVTLTTPSTAGDIVTITRMTPADRENLYTNTNFTPTMLNNDFGILTMVDQQAQLVNSQIAPRYNYSALINVNAATEDTILPILPANMTWVKNNANTAIESYYLPPGGVAPAGATYVLLSPNSDLTNAFALNSIGQGLLVNVPGTPTLTVTTVLGTTNQITVANGSGTGGNIGLAIATNPIMPGTGSIGIPTGSTAQRSSAPQDGWFRYNTSFHLLEYYSTPTASWVQLGDNGAVAPGTINDLAYYAATGNTVSPLASANNGVLITGSSGIPSISSTLPSGLTIPSPYINEIVDVNGNNVLQFVDQASAVNYGVIRNGATGHSVHYSADGADANVQVTLIAKAAGEVVLATTAPTNAFQFYSGTAYQHSMIFAMPNTANITTTTWQDSSGTVAWLSDVAGTVTSAQGTAHQVLVNGTSGSAQTGAIILTTPQNIDTNSNVIFNSLQLTQALSSTYGGTGVNNGGHLLEWNGDMTWIGAFTFQATLTGNTSVQFPTSGLLATTAGSVATLTGDSGTATASSGNINVVGTGSGLTFTGSAATLTLGGTLNASHGGTGLTSLGTGVATALGINVGSAGAFVVNGGALGTPSSGTLSSCTGLPISTGVSGLGTGVATALAINVGSAGAFVTFNGAGGTPSSITLTNGTGLPIAGITGLGTGVATALAANVTGSGGIVLATSATLVTPTLGAASATSLTFSSTSGIIGATTNNSAAAGSVGEFISANSALNTTSVTSGTPADILSISLTAGDWDVGGNIGFFGAASTIPALLEGWVNSTSASNPGGQFTAYQQPGGTPFAVAPLAFVVPTQRFSLSGTTTIYLSTITSFSVSTLAAGGFLWARRRR